LTVRVVEVIKAASFAGLALAIYLRSLGSQNLGMKSNLIPASSRSRTRPAEEIRKQWHIPGMISRQNLIHKLSKIHENRD